MTDEPAGEVAALRALTAGDTGAARAALAARADRPLLNAALATYLADTGDGHVYDRPAAFTAFIRGGGNVELYAAVSAALAERYRRLGVESLVDIGCGDGRALVPALAAAGKCPALTLVEPSAALLSAALAALAGHADPARVTAHAADAAAFTADLTERFDLAESTFAMHAIPPAEREAVLTALRGHVGHLVLAEFDHPAAGPGHLTFLADSYERGLTEYDADRDLVAQGFLMPVLTGQLAPGAPRSTWEQPATAWAARLEACGYREVTVEPLCDYWSSPAFLLTARA